MTDDHAKGRATGYDSPAKAWARALHLTASIARHPDRVFPDVIEDCALRFAEAPALLSEPESLTYRALAARANQYTRWALAQDLGKGDCVGLLMSNRPEFIAIWLGLTRAGAVVALLNTNLNGPSLAHSINIVSPKHLIVAAELVDRLPNALPHLANPANIWIHGSGHGSFRRLDPEIERIGDEKLAGEERRPLNIDDRALYIYTSGTTGLPKASVISHGRVMQWSHWFAGMLDTQSSDRMYDCLPMYHGVGGVQAPGAVLVRGGSVVLREKFSARQFWADVVRWDCTLFQYIGELCRYLLHTQYSPQETTHRIRVACGNGLRREVWDEFKKRFRIPRILEFYASTEGNVSLFNVEGEPGAVGRLPVYLAHRFPARLIKFDVAKGQLVRDEQGFCTPCELNEAGEAIGQLLNDPSNIGNRFEGYTCQEASNNRILRDVFERGDAWFRTSDLLRKDESGYFHFVDRIGDTFRWKAENVATSEISEALCSFPGIKEASVYGVSIPGTDGRAGMATLVCHAELDLTALRTYLRDRLPEYARPLFLRIRDEMEVTATFKYTKTDLVRQGYDPAATSDTIYFNDPEREAFIRLDQIQYECIQTGQLHPWLWRPQNPICPQARESRCSP
jgi:fatty-acyl-CoA synthase